MKNLRVVVFSLAAFIMLAFGAYASFSNTWIFGIAAGTSTVLFFFGHLDQFKRFKAGPSGGIEAELKEVVRDAAAKIDQLRSLARVWGEATLWQAAKTGRFWTSDTDERRLEFQQKVFEVFDQLGLDERAKAHAARDLRRLTRIDYAIALTGGSTVEYLPLGMHDERSQLLEYDTNVERVRDFLKRAGQLDAAAKPELHELLLDFQHYCDTGEHRRLDVFLDRETWPGKYLRKIPR